MLTTDEQALFDFAIGSLPSWVRSQDEVLTAMAKIFGATWAQVKYIFQQALITSAQGATATTPDWLNQHARDRDTARQVSEDDPTLAERLRVIPDALTRGALLTAINAIVAASGVIGQAAMVELPRDRARIGTYGQLFGAGGTFTKVGSAMTFQPVLGWPALPWRDPSVAPTILARLNISSATSSGNNGTFSVTGLTNNAVNYTNAIGVAGLDTSAVWQLDRLDVAGNTRDGYARAFVGRGYRVTTSRPSKILIILPYGTTAATAASIAESVRLKKAAGYGVIIERRINP